MERTSSRSPRGFLSSSGERNGNPEHAPAESLADRPRRVTQLEYDGLWAARRDELDDMPGGAQGANPDMSDVEVEEDIPTVSVDEAAARRQKNKKRGADAKAAGKAFEKAVDTDLLLLQQRGVIAHWWSNNPGWTRRGPTWVPTEASGADRAGTLRTAISFALELKSTGCDPKGKLRAFERNRISMRQEAHLENTARARAVALVGLEFRLETQHVWFLVPWARMPWNGKKSIGIGDLLEFAIPAAGFGDAFVTHCEDMTAWARHR